MPRTRAAIRSITASSRWRPPARRSRWRPSIRRPAREPWRGRFRLFRDTAIRLQDGKAPDKRLTFEDIEAFRELLLPLDRHASEVWVDGFQLTSNTVTSIESIVGNAIPSNGEVTGSLERLNLHDRYEFVLFPAAGSRIVCTFEESLLEQVRRGIKRVVTVFGVLYFQPDKPLPDRVRVKRMEIHPPNEALATREPEGIFRDAPAI